MNITLISFIVVFVGGCIIVGGAFLSELIHPSKPENDPTIKKMNAVRDICELKGHTLHVYKRSKRISKLISIKKTRTYVYRQNPEELHFDSISIGGVTTGNVYKTGGDYSVRSWNEGRYLLLYMNNPYFAIHSIVLSDEIADKAKISNISTYLNDNTIEVITKSVISPTTKVLAEGGHHVQAINQMNMDNAKCYPTKAKCKSIINWLSDEAE